MVANETNMDADCETFLVYDGCGFKTNDYYAIMNAVSSLSYTVIATAILLLNTMLFASFIIQRKHLLASVTIFSRYCSMFIFIYNILSSFLTYLASFDFCFGFNSNYYFCLIKNCLIYMIGIMLMKMTFLIALERLISVRWMQKYRTLITTKYFFMSNVALTLCAFGFTFSPFLFNWNNYKPNCFCGLNNVLPKAYVLTMNTIFMAIASSTILIYFYIYYYVKNTHSKTRAPPHRGRTPSVMTSSQQMKRMSNESKQIKQTTKLASNSSFANLKGRKDKIQLLKIQTVLFFVFLTSWFPFIFMTSYEAVRNINRYGLEATIRNFTLIFIMISCLVYPLVYVFRFKPLYLNPFNICCRTLLKCKV